MPKIRYFYRFIVCAYFICFDLFSRCLLFFWFNIPNKKKVYKKFKYGFVFTSDLGDMVIFSMFLLVFCKKTDSNCIVITSEANARAAKSLLLEIDYLVVNYHNYKTDQA